MSLHIGVYSLSLWIKIIKYRMNKNKWFNSIYLYQLTWVLSVLSFLLGGKFRPTLNRSLSQFQRIIEVGGTKIRFASFCSNETGSNYLGLLTRDGTIGGKSKGYILEADEYFSIRRNNADVLILAEKAELERMWFFDEYKHTLYICYAPTNLLGLISGFPGLLKNTVFRRIKVSGLLSLKDDSGIKQPVLLVKILKRVTPNARRFVSPHLGVTGFFENLNHQQINYAILRWFEDLPVIMPGEDIDMLVADEDIERVESLLQKQPGIIPCDIYTVSGLPGTAYKNMAYYPPLLAEEILAKAIAFKDSFFVPSPEIHFYSLAYHAIYHKGHKSGIPWSLAEIESVKRDPEHQYGDILQNLASSLSIEVDITLEGLDRFLNSINWRPSEDTLARLDSSQIWSTQENKNNRVEPSTDISGLAVFFIRQKALDLNLETEITELLKKEGFNIIKAKMLGKKKAKRVKYQVRGGNWGKGPWSESGGDPAMVLVAVDLMPILPTPEALAKQPHLSNNRIGVKNKIRDAVNRSLPPEKQCNTVHSSDNEREAWNYLEITFPHKLQKFERKIDLLRKNFETNYNVKQILTRFGRRAKVEVIEYDNQLAVKKTFKPGCEKFFQREAFVSQCFADDSSAIPTLLDCGANYLVYPYYDDVLKFRNRQSKLLPLAIAKQSLQTLKFFYDRGYALIDFQPANIIVDRTSGLKVIDFEFLYQYQNLPESFEQCYELTGIPDDFVGDKPSFKLPMSYQVRWKPYVGLSLDSLLHDPVWLQHIKRFGFAITRLPFRFINNRFKKILSQKKYKFSSLLSPLKQLLSSRLT